MKKINVLLIMSAVSAFTLVGCTNEMTVKTEDSVSQNSKQSSKEIENAILSYLNEDLKELSTKEAKIISLYESVTGENYTDDETTYNMLLNEIVPQYREFIGDVEAVDVKNAELSDIHEIYIKAINMQNSGFITSLTAIEEQDLEKLNQANNQLAEGRKMIREYQQKLETFANENNVKIIKP